MFVLTAAQKEQSNLNNLISLLIFKQKKKEFIMTENNNDNQKENEKNRLILLGIIVAIGIILITVGVILIIRSGLINVPNMGDPGWFDADTNRMDLEFAGESLIAFGIFVVISASITLTTLKKGKNKSNDLNSDQKKIINEIKIKTNETKINHICEYCGLNVPGKSVCPYCGSKKFK